MGVWGTLAGLGKVAAGAIPGVGPLIGMGIDVAQGAIGSRAANKASEAQQKAAREIAESARKVSGTAADDITNAGAVTIDQLLTAGNDAAGNMRTATDNAQQGVRRVGEEAAQGFRLSADEANGLLRSIYGDSIGWLDPFREGGAQAFQAATEMATGPQTKFSAADMELDPGYAFRLAEGQKALERSAAARGTLQSGSTLKGLTRYAQGVASDEYGKAFDRFQQERNSRFSMLANLTGTGLRAAESSANVGSQYAARAGGNIMDAGTQGGQMLYRSEADAAGYGMQGTDASNRYLTQAAQNAGSTRLNSVGQAGQFRMDGERIAATATAGGANANAAGIMGSANAWGTTLGSIGQRLQALPAPSGGTGKTQISTGWNGAGDAEPSGAWSGEAQPFMRLPQLQPQTLNPWMQDPPPYYRRQEPIPPIQMQAQVPAQTATPAPREQVNSTIKFDSVDDKTKGGGK